MLVFMFHIMFYELKFTKTKKNEMKNRRKNVLFVVG